MFDKINENGFSMIEIVVAFGILVLTFVSLAQAFPVGLSINKSSENSTTAYYLAQSKAEELSSLDYDDVSIGVFEARHRLSEDQSDYLYNYERETNVVYVDGSFDEVVDDQGIKKIITEIYYNDAISKNESIFNLTYSISEN